MQHSPHAFTHRQTKAFLTPNSLALSFKRPNSYLKSPLVFCDKRHSTRIVSCRGASPQRVTLEVEQKCKSLGWGVLLGCIPLLLSMDARAEGEEELIIVKAGGNDWIISAAFTIAIIALGAVTLGVAYLAFLTWNDKRTEKQEREQFEQVLKDRELSKKYDGSKRESKPRKKAKSENKGFG